jgi:hypothetical protein
MELLATPPVAHQASSRRGLEGSLVVLAKARFEFPLTPREVRAHSLNAVNCVDAS